MNALASENDSARAPRSLKSAMIQRVVSTAELTFSATQELMRQLQPSTRFGLDRLRLAPIAGIRRSWWGDSSHDDWIVYSDSELQVMVLVAPQRSADASDRWMVLSRQSDQRLIVTDNSTRPGSTRSAQGELRGTMGRIGDDVSGHCRHLFRTRSRTGCHPLRFHNSTQVMTAFREATSQATPASEVVSRATNAMLLFGIPCALVACLGWYLLTAVMA